MSTGQKIWLVCMGALAVTALMLLAYMPKVQQPVISTPALIIMYAALIVVFLILAYRRQNKKLAIVLTVVMIVLFILSINIFAGTLKQKGAEGPQTQRYTTVLPQDG